MPMVTALYSKTNRNKSNNHERLERYTGPTFRIAPYKAQKPTHSNVEYKSQTNKFFFSPMKQELKLNGSSRTPITHIHEPSAASLRVIIN